MTTTKAIGQRVKFNKLLKCHESILEKGSGQLPQWQRPVALMEEPVIRIAKAIQRNMKLVNSTVVEAMRELVAGEAPWPLFIYGGVGTGKTCAALALADFCRSAHYTTVDELCDHVMQGKGFASLQKKELVIVDEIGARSNVGDLLYSSLKRVLDEREMHSHRKGIYVSNKNPDELAKLYDDRVVSRLCAGVMIELTGDDRRIA
jgi:DNA replication protein DnaC